MKRLKIGAGGLALTAAVYFLIFSAVRYNLSAASAVIDRQEHCIVIDAGHGGEDGGATGISGSSESRINLEISLRLEQLLRLCGYETYLIRSADTAVYTGDCHTITEKKISDLKNRVRIVNQLHPAVLVSIHQNHFSEEKYSGSQVFYAKTETSKELAAQMQEMLRIAVDSKNHRQCKPADSVYLMEHIDCPGVLVECGFLSNRQEEQRLQQPEYQKKLVCAITGALAQYLQEGDSRLEV